MNSRAITAILVISMLFLAGCNTATTISQGIEDATGLHISIGKSDIDMAEITRKIAQLPRIDNQTVLTKDNFQEVYNKFNLMIEILNNEAGFDFQKLQLTKKSFNKVSKAITKYSPLINNYNEIIDAASSYNEEDEDSVKSFYTASAIFGLEITLIVTAVFYGAIFKGVGIVYRATGLNRLAFSCPTCIRVVLSQAHWFVRIYMVEKSGEAAKWLLDKTEELMDKLGGLEGIKEKTKEGYVKYSALLEEKIREISTSTANSS